jgi:hypothetical protein
MEHSMEALSPSLFLCADSSTVTQPLTANCAHLLLLISERLNVTVETFEDIASDVIFLQQPVLKEVMSMGDAMAKRISGPYTPLENHC